MSQESKTNASAHEYLARLRKANEAFEFFVEHIEEHGLPTCGSNDQADELRKQSDRARGLWGRWFGTVTTLTEWAKEQQ